MSVRSRFYLGQVLGGSPSVSKPLYCQQQWAEPQGRRWEIKNNPSWAAAQLSGGVCVSPFCHPSSERATSPPHPPCDSDLPAWARCSPPPENSAPSTSLSLITLVGAPSTREQPLGMRGALGDSPEPRNLGSDANFAADSWDIPGSPLLSQLVFPPKGGAGSIQAFHKVQKSRRR